MSRPRGLTPEQTQEIRTILARVLADASRPINDYYALRSVHMSENPHYIMGRIQEAVSNADALIEIWTRK